MPTYFVVNDTVTDVEMLAAYGAAARSTIKPFGVEVIVNTTTAEAVEGTPAGPRVVILKFADRAAFDAWYNSPEYQDIIAGRLDATSGFGMVVEGR
jgi:uncharacterized protein (DUF1330 family)